MSKHKNLKRNLLICLLAGSAVMYTLPLHAATSVIANNTLPSGGQFVHGEGNIASSGLEMNITQNGQNAVIKWMILALAAMLRLILIIQEKIILIP